MTNQFSSLSDVGNVTIYWTLQTIFYSVMVVCGYGISFKNKVCSDRYCIASILIFSIYEGIRWLRGADYAHYYMDLTEGIWAENPEPVYKLIVAVFSNFPFYIAFIFYGFLLITPVVLIIRRYNEEAYWMLPLFILIVTSSFECFIRQYIATGFFLFGFYYWIKENRKTGIIFFLVAIFTHQAFLFPLLIFMSCCMSLMKKEINSVWWLICIYSILYWGWDISYLGPYATYLKLIDFSDDTIFGGYMENSERWFTEEGSLSLRGGVSTTSATITKTVLFLMNNLTIYWGFKFRKKKLEIKIFFWFTYWALLIKCIAVDVELLLRLYHLLIYMMPFMMGYLINNIKVKRYRDLYISLILLYYVGYDYLLHLGTRPYSGCGFIWDK